MTLTSTSSDKTLEEAATAPSATETPTEAMATPTPASPPILESQRPRGRPPVQSACLLYGELPGEGEPRVLVTQTALQQIEAHSRSNVKTEVGGALLGYAYRHNEQLFVEVRAAIPAISPDHGPVHFTFTADVWVQLHHDRAAYPDLEIVGWFHTHPDLGVFFSADDLVVHSAAFRQTWQVALVVDPVRREACFYGWVAGELWALPGFYELLSPAATEDDQPDFPSVDWTVVDHSGLAGDVPLPTPLHVVSPAEPFSLPPISPWVGVFLGGLSLIVSIIALILVARL